MTPETISATAGVILSLVFSYLPVLSDKYNALDNTRQRLIMAALIVAAAAGTVAWGCRADAAFGVCTFANWDSNLRVLFAALVANQGAFLISPHKK